MVVSWTATAVLLAACTDSNGSSNSSPPADGPGSATANAQTSLSSSGADLAAELDEVIKHSRALAPHYNLSVPGGIVLVAQDGQVRSYAFGEAQLRPRRMMRANDRFPLGSNSKTLLATVVMQLVQEGALTLDDTVEKWLPGVVPVGDQIRVEDLLSMRSGLFDAVAVPGFDLGADLTRANLRDLLDHPLTDPPGSKSRYSNVNYILLGKIVEAATGRPLRAELRARVFKPAGMSDADVATNLNTEARLPEGYDAQHRDDTRGDITALFGAGQVVGTAADLAAFYRALYGGGLLRPKLLRDMTTPRGTLPQGPGYGLGTMVFSLECTDAIGHGGELGGFESVAMHDPDTGRTVIAMVNQSGKVGIDAVYSLAVDALCF